MLVEDLKELHYGKKNLQAQLALNYLTFWNEKSTRQANLLFYTQ